MWCAFIALHFLPHFSLQGFVVPHRSSAAPLFLRKNCFLALYFCGNDFASSLIAQAALICCTFTTQLCQRQRQ